jgi:predicted nucleic acid-binding protein
LENGHDVSPAWSKPASATFPLVKASAIDYLVDAGPLIGLLNRGDQWHGWIRETLTILNERLATTETVVAEACHRLCRLRQALAELAKMIKEERVFSLPFSFGITTLKRCIGL